MRSPSQPTLSKSGSTTSPPTAGASAENSPPTRSSSAAGPIEFDRRGTAGIRLLCGQPQPLWLYRATSAQSVVKLWWGAEFIAQARRNGAVEVGDAEPSAQLRADQRATGVAHHVLLRIQGGDHPAGELWRLPRDARTFPWGQRREIGVAALGAQVAHPDRHGGDVVWAQFFRHVRSHLVGTGFLRTVGRPLVIRHRAVIAGVDDEAASVCDEQRRSVVGGDEVGPEP